MRRIERAVTPGTSDFKLKKETQSPIPLSAIKYNALQRMLPHVPQHHHSFYNNLPRESDSGDESDSSYPQQQATCSAEARMRRMIENDSFLAGFDEFLPEKIQKELQTSESRA